MGIINLLSINLLANNNSDNNNKILNFNLEVAPLFSSNRFNHYKILLTLLIKFKIVTELQIVLEEQCLSHRKSLPLFSNLEVPTQIWLQFNQLRLDNLEVQDNFRTSNNHLH